MIRQRPGTSLCKSGRPRDGAPANPARTHGTLDGAGQMRPTNLRRARANLFALTLLILSAAWGAPARGAALSVDAPDSCVDPAALAEEVSDLIGKPLASVAEVDFRIQIAKTPHQRWRLKLETVEQHPAGAGEPAVRGSREIEGTTCAELAEAASVAIAVSVRSIAGEAGPAQPQPQPALLPPPPSPPVAAPPSLERSGEETPSWRPAIALALTTDTGALPSTSIGVGLAGSLQRRSLQLALLATWFGSEDATAADHTGGTFQLVVGGARACFAPRRGRWTPLACGGFELGRLSGTGQGVARPETGEALWRALRADLGVTMALGGNTALLLTGGVAVPLARPAFVHDGSDLVYRPSRLAGRLTAGLQIGF
jgi:hypothetical protein